MQNNVYGLGYDGINHLHKTSRRLISIMFDKKLFSLGKCLFFIILFIALLVQPSHATIFHYVDPDWNGTKSGTASQPWSDLGFSAWSKINSELATDDVTVYFSAREAGSDTNEMWSTSTFVVDRDDTDVSKQTTRLTLDGNAKYNTNDSSPAWRDYYGSSKFQINASSMGIASSASVVRSYVTIKGFKVVASSGGSGHIVSLGAGDSIVIQDCELTHHTNMSADFSGLYFHYVRDGHTEIPCVANDVHTCRSSNGITIKNNVIHDTHGECLYIGGISGGDSFCANCTEDGHTNILIENNTIYNCGTLGGEGDMIDIKPENSNITVRGNTIYMAPPHVGKGVIGVGINAVATVENNFIYNTGSGGIVFKDYWNQLANDDSTWRNGGVIRNNIIVNAGQDPAEAGAWNDGILVGWEETFGTDHWANVKIYNNTVYAAVGNGIEVQGNSNTRVDVRNNIASQCGGMEFSANANTLSTHDYNDYYDTSGTIFNYGGIARTCDTITLSETNSICSDPQFFSTTQPYVDKNFRILENSPPRNLGVSIPSFNHDYFNVIRDANWDMGAIEFVIHPTPPENVRLLIE